MVFDGYVRQPIHHGSGSGGVGGGVGGGGGKSTHFKLLT